MKKAILMIGTIWMIGCLLCGCTDSKGNVSDSSNGMIDEGQSSTASTGIMDDLNRIEDELMPSENDDTDENGNSARGRMTR